MVIAIYIMIMNTKIKSLILGGTMLSAASAFAGVATEIAPVPAPASGVEFEATLGYNSIYEFRGSDFGDNMIEAGFSLSNEFSNGYSLSGGIWYADTRGTGDQESFNELDVYAGIGKSWGKFDLSLGYTYYAFPNSIGSDTSEFSFGVATETYYGIGLGLTYFQDVDAISGGYLEFEASKSFELTETVGLDLSAGVAWSFNYSLDIDGGNLDGYNHFFVKAALPWNFYGDFTVTPYAKYVGVSNEMASDINTGESENNFFGGVGLSYSF
jgi:hypothetical protein